MNNTNSSAEIRSDAKSWIQDRFIDIDLEIALFKHRLSEHSVDIDVIVLSDSTTASPSQGGDK